MTRILLVESVDDALTQRRHLRLETSSLLESYRISYCFASSINLDAVCCSGEELEKLLKLDEDGLFERVQTAIVAERPKHVIVHTGLIFSRNIELYYAVFAKLADLHPKVVFSIQERPGLDFPSDVFACNVVVKKLHALIFNTVLRMPSASA
jgi:hypothetical protein